MLFVIQLTPSLVVPLLRNAIVQLRSNSGQLVEQSTVAVICRVSCRKMLFRLLPL